MEHQSNFNKDIFLKLLVIVASLIGICITVYGINWGLPSRWCIDEPVAVALRMIADKSIVPSTLLHPTFHYFVLIFFLAPVLIILKIVGYPLLVVKEAASVSWIYLSTVDTIFPTIAYITARLSSAIFVGMCIYLAYKIAKICYGKAAGVYSAFFLSVTMGFISEGHTAKNTTFVMFMIMLTVYFCLKYYKDNKPAKLWIPFFIGGLTGATKYNGFIVIVPLLFYFFGTLIKQDKENKSNRFLSKFIIIPPVSFLSGFILGFPALLTPRYFPEFLSSIGFWKRTYVPEISTSLPLLFIAGIAGYFFELKEIFGWPLFTLVIFGIFVSWVKIRNNVYAKIVLLTTVSYYLIFCFASRDFETKYIIPIVPFLIILSSGLMKLVFGRSYYRKIAYAILAVIFIASFSYTLWCDGIYARNDIRYMSTRWIEENVNKDKRLIILDQPDWVIHNRLFQNYDILVLKNSPRGIASKNNYHFINGQQYTLTKKEIDKILYELRGKHDYYIICSVFIIRERTCPWKYEEKIYTGGIHLDHLDRYRIVKEFRNVNNCFWSYNLGGYEPDKIVILSGD